MTRKLEVARRTSLCFALAVLAAGCGGGSSPSPSPSPTPSGCTSGSSTTQLQVTNATTTAVPVLLTLGTTRSAASNYGIDDVNKLPAAWRTYPFYPPGSTGPVIQSIFLLGAGESVCFNSGALSFAGQVTFGPNFSQRGCGDVDTTRCFPDASSAFEFALNLGSSGQETVDISGVNGTNALGVWNLDATPVWTNTRTSDSVTRIQNAPIASWTSPANGVYGWQATDCIDVVQPIPNPIPGCLAPLHLPSPVAQLQASRVCNVSRATGATGGTAQIVFNGYAPGAAPGIACVGAFGNLVPAHGSPLGGTTVTVNGYGLDRVTAVTFQGQTATIVGTPTANQLVLRTPAFPYCPSPAVATNAAVQYVVSGVASPVVPVPPGDTFTYDCQ